MLHEVLLALSGHPTPLFGDQSAAFAKDADRELLLLSPSEKALLQSIGDLSNLHRMLKRRLESISPTHPSIICRAVATSIRQTHLARFQRKIIDVERRILRRDASVVGAYNIVPLASVVGEFHDWHRRMAWYWDIACFMLPLDDTQRSVSSNTGCSGATLIDKLRSEAQTGYREIEDAAVELSRVAETAWLRQLSSWVVYGRLPAFGEHDFFIQIEPPGSETFVEVKDLVPTFVSSSTAKAIMFAGRSLHQVAHHRRDVGSLFSSSLSDSELARESMKQLSSISLPIIPTQLSLAISNLRHSLSKHALQHLLPNETILLVLSCLRQYFLLERGDFATSLITEAEKRIQTRQQSMGSLLQQNLVKAMNSLTINDSELSQTLRHTWKALRIEGEDDQDELLEYAQKHISLVVAKSSESAPLTTASINGASPELSTVAFNNALFPNPTKLSFKIGSPIDLILSPADVEVYSVINDYLVAIRRSHLKLRNLWRRTSVRREVPGSAIEESGAREQKASRAVAMRKVWATCSAANFLLSETAAFFEGEVIRGSCRHFQEWVETPVSDPERVNFTASASEESPDDAEQHDPETLASGHRRFLASLTFALLLTDASFTRELRSLLHNVDNLIAFFSRLIDTQQQNDGNQAADHPPQRMHSVGEGTTVALELDRARKKVDGDLRSVVNRLRQLDRERIGSLRYLQLPPGERGDFEPWKGGGVERLLMKLEFGRLTVTGKDVD